MENFSNNPSDWNIEGNIIGSELGGLTTLSNFLNTRAVVAYDTPQVVSGNTITMVKVTFGG